MLLSDFAPVETPAALVDLDIAASNIARYQRYCDSHRIRLRPHIKTHKLPRLARLQIEQGAVGITCQKLSEADAMLQDNAIKDVFISYNLIGEDKYKRLRPLMERVKLSVAADNAIVIDGLNAALSSAGRQLNVLVECDTGARRCGVMTPQAARDLAQRIERSGNLRFGGLMTYPPVGGTKTVQDFMTVAKTLIEELGISVETITSGGSPDMWHAHESPVITEYRPGTYVYNDRSLVERGVCGYEDCALSVLATVISVPDQHRAIIDAGSKVLTADLFGLSGHGRVLGRDDIVIDQLTEEHGRLISTSPIGLTVGERVRVVPNHVCVVVNMFDDVVLIKDGTVLCEEQVAARGKVW